MRIIRFYGKGAAEILDCFTKKELYSYARSVGVLCPASTPKNDIINSLIRALPNGVPVGMQLGRV